MKRIFSLISTLVYVLLLAATNLLIFTAPAEAAPTRLTDDDIKSAELTWINRAYIQVDIAGQSYSFYDEDIDDGTHEFAVQGYGCYGRIFFHPANRYDVTSDDKADLDMDIVPSNSAGSDCVGIDGNKVKDLTIAKPEQGRIYYVQSEGDPNTIIRVDGNDDWTFVRSDNESFPNIFVRSSEGDDSCQDRIVLGSGPTDGGTFTLYELDHDTNGSKVTGIGLSNGETCYLESTPQAGVASGVAYPLRVQTADESSRSQATSSTSLSGNDAPTCETTGGNPISWLLCPAINSVSSIADWILENMVQPFLDRIPISINPTDPTFQAWSAFRAVANIILILVLVIAVIAQAAGS